MILALSLPSSGWDFATRHPGILLVLLGVAGEVIFDWNEMKGRLAWAKRISAFVLIVGLILEFYEAANSDKEVSASIERAGNAEKEAKQASLLATEMGTTNAQLSLRVEELRSNNLVNFKIIEGLRSNNFVTEKQVEELRKENLQLENRMVTGLYARSHFEIVSINDKNRVTIQRNGWGTRVFVLLPKAPVSVSINGTITWHSGFIRGFLGLIAGAEYNKFLPIVFGNNKNVLYSNLGAPQWDFLEYPADAQFIIRYTGLEQETNLWEKVELKGKDVYFDNIKQTFQ